MIWTRCFEPSNLEVLKVTKLKSLKIDLNVYHTNSVDRVTYEFPFKVWKVL